MAAQKHIHRWVRLQYRVGRRKVDKLTKGQRTFICSLPDCSSTKPQNEIDGKFSVCTNCGAEFIMRYPAITRVNPRCIKCMHTKEAKALVESQNLISESLGALDFTKVKGNYDILNPEEQELFSEEDKKYANDSDKNSSSLRDILSGG